VQVVSKAQKTQKTHPSVVSMVLVAKAANSGEMSLI
jgi:hypothetical protein